MRSPGTTSPGEELRGGVDDPSGRAQLGYKASNNESNESQEPALGRSEIILCVRRTI